MNIMDNLSKDNQKEKNPDKIIGNEKRNDLLLSMHQTESTRHILTANVNASG